MWNAQEALVQDRANGMVWCPQRLSHLALMRCWSYQEGGCGCPHRTTQAEFDQIQFNLRDHPEDPEPLLGELPLEDNLLPIATEGSFDL